MSCSSTLISSFTWDITSFEFPLQFVKVSETPLLTSSLVLVCVPLPVWVFIWSLKWPNQEDEDSHRVHLKWGLSPMWVLICLFKLSEWENEDSHKVHLKGFSPVWVLKCFFKSPDWKKGDSHKGHSEPWPHLNVVALPRVYSNGSRNNGFIPSLKQSEVPRTQALESRVSTTSVVTQLDIHTGPFPICTEEEWSLSK